MFHRRFWMPPLRDGAARRKARAAAACLLAAFLLGQLSDALAADARLTLAGQFDWGARKGFYLNLENSFTTAPGALSGMIIALGVADGSNWRFVVNHPAWEYDRTYAVRASVSPARSELWLGGVSLGFVNAGAVPTGAMQVTCNEIPGWASAPTEYYVDQTSVTISGPGGATLSATTSENTTRSMALTLMQSPGPASMLSWTFASGDSFTVETTFTIVRRADAVALSPLADRYGQFRYGEWPGKVHSDADLLTAKSQEETQNQAWGIPAGYDVYGGDTRADWHDTATGFFHLVNRNGFWWLISPEGHPCFYRGVCDGPGLTWDKTPVTGRETMFEWLPPRTGNYAVMWAWNVWGDGPGHEYVASHSPNLLLKYGASWPQTFTTTTAYRYDVWGFSGGAKWDEVPGRPVTPVLGRSGVPNVARHPDIFDAAIRTQFESVLRSQITPRLLDPFVVGWSVGNEMDEIINVDEIKTVLGMDQTVAAKRALVDYGLATIYGGDVTSMSTAWHSPLPTTASLYATPAQAPDDDVESVRRYYADRYYAFLYQTIKAIDPNHLYLGFWIVPGWWQNDQDWRLITPWCDVIGYDRYAQTFTDASLDALVNESGKPVLCGEFSFPPNYPGTRGYGTYGVSVPNDVAAGEAYKAWLASATTNPHCVGVAWFQYRDQPVLGRGPGSGTDPIYGEHYAFGLVDVTDHPKWDLVTRVREANLQASQRRLDATARARVENAERDYPN
jgi:hypothetical protein